MKRPRAIFVVGLALALSALVVFMLRYDPGGLTIPGPHAVDFAGLDAGPRAPPVASEGCGLALAEAGTRDGTILADGVPRTYEMAVPAHYDPRRPHPLFLVFHGNGNDAAAMHRMLTLEERSSDSVVAIYPRAVMRRVWADHVAPHWGKVEDLPLFDALVAHAKRTLCIDERRIFAVGWSSGGYFANQLGCVRPQVIRGFAALSGGGPENAECTKPVAGFIHHDRDDASVLVTEGRASRDRWEKTNGCSASHEHAGCTTYTCDAPLVYCETSGNGHGVPASAKDAAYEFFSAL